MATINAIGSSSPIELSKGGTGATTLTGIVRGNGSSAMTALTYTPFTAYVPTVSGTVVAGAGTYTVQAGAYCQIANMVFVQASITWTAHTGTGDMIISIPIATNSTANYDPEAIVNTINIPLPGGTSRTVLGSATPGATFIDTYVTTTSGANNPIALNATGTLHMNYTYSV